MEFVAPHVSLLRLGNGTEADHRMVMYFVQFTDKV